MIRSQQQYQQFVNDNSSDRRLYDPLPTMTRADDRCNNVINLVHISTYYCVFADDRNETNAMLSFVDLNVWVWTSAVGHLVVHTIE